MIRRKEHPTFNVQRSTLKRAGVLLALLALVALPASAQDKDLRTANRTDCSTRGTNDWKAASPVHYYVTGTNNWVAFSNQPSAVISVEISNFSGSDVYLLVFNKGTNAVAGDAPVASPVLVATGTTGGKNWAPNGFPLTHLCVAASTTPNSLTNAAAGLGVITVTRRMW